VKGRNYHTCICDDHGWCLATRDIILYELLQCLHVHLVGVLPVRHRADHRLGETELQRQTHIQMNINMNFSKRCKKRIEREREREREKERGEKERGGEREGKEREAERERKSDVLSKSFT
jgi:hypothetical protein